MTVCAFACLSVFVFVCVCVSVCLFVWSESEFCSQHKKKQNAIPKSSSDIFLGAKEDAWGIKKCSMLFVSFSSLITHTHTHTPPHTHTRTDPDTHLLSDAHARRRLRHRHRHTRTPMVTQSRTHAHPL